MAGVLKGRDTDGTVRTITAVKARDPGSVSRTLQFVRVRGTDGVLREVFTAGGTPPPSNPASITPGQVDTASKSAFRSATFTASSSGAAPSSYSWGLFSGSGSVTAGQGTSTATLQVYADPGTTVESVFFCDVVVGGTTYRAFCYFNHANTTGSGGAPIQ